MSQKSILYEITPLNSFYCRYILTFNNIDMVFAFKGDFVHSKCVMSNTKIKFNARDDLDSSGFLSMGDNPCVVLVFAIPSSLQMCTVSSNTLIRSSCIEYMIKNIVTELKLLNLIQSYINMHPVMRL